MIVVLWLCGKDASAFRRGTRLSIWATGLAAALLAILFLLMAVATNHNDTWWNADLVWALGRFRNVLDGHEKETWGEIRRFGVGTTFGNGLDHSGHFLGVCRSIFSFQPLLG